MSHLKHILPLFLIISLVSIEAFSQEPASKDETSRTQGLKKITDNANRSRNYDIRIDERELKANIDEAVENALRSMEVALERLERLEISIDPIEIDMEDLNIDLDPIVINIPNFNFDIEPIEIELDELDELDDDFGNDDEDNDEWKDGEGDQNKDKHKDKNKAKHKSDHKDKSNKSDKSEHHKDKAKAKGLKKID